MGAADDGRWHQIGGWSLVVLALALLVSVPFSLAGDVMSRPDVVTCGPDAWNAVIVTSFVLSGGVLVHLRPRNPIGGSSWSPGCSRSPTSPRTRTRPER